MRLYQLFSLLFFLFYPLLSSSFSNTASLQLCHHDQTIALLLFKNIFSIDSSASFYCDIRPFGFPNTSYPKILSWKENTDCCSWDGVTCDRVTGHVIGLDLSCSQLQGTIHSNSSLFLLPHLRWLNLSFNDFNHSRISSKFGQFASLTHLNLSHAGFSGHIPSEISHLSKLVSLDLSWNPERYSEINLLRLDTPNLKKLVQNLTELEELHLSEVNMSSVEIGSLRNLSSSLTALSLERCGLQGNFPDNIFGLPQLQTLKLNYNHDLTSYSPRVNWSKSLVNLYLGDTSFSGELLDSIGNLQSLKVLDLSSNHFSGSIPAWLGNLTQISYLDLTYNNFSGQIPSSLSKLEQLTSLVLYGNHFSGSIPAWLGNLTQISYLDLSINNFNGQIPPSLSKLEQLTSLRLYRNHFSGSIPAWLGNLTQISDLDLSSNNFSGQIPSSLSKLEQLTSLWLTDNHFSGSIPAWLGNLTKISGLDLGSNNFGGQIPSSLSKLEQLSWLSLRGNHFNGSIPASLGNLTKIYYLDLSSNNFSGSIPAWLGNLTKISILGLSNNHFNGSIPACLGNLTQIRKLDLSSNNLSGQIPSSLLKLEQLSYLNLSFNHFSGYFSYPGVEQLPWKNLKYLDLHSNMLQGPLPIPSLSTSIFLISNNNFSGKIPYSICNASSLEVLDLSNNNLSGMIPQCLGNFSNYLIVLDLRMNNFHGTIPGTFAKGNILKTLDFNGNQLEGPVPESLMKCRHLEVLDLGHNKIHDIFPNWLDTLPELHVLVLRSNRFYGPIGNSETKFPFPKLRIIDLSYNEFIGLLPEKYFKTLKAMMNVDEENIEQRHTERQYYQDSVMVTMKGFEYKLEKILTIFTAIDLSNNKFEGEIPKFIGNLKSLRVLNLSHNSLTGHMPPSVGNLTLLESLDLSLNKLDGVIPFEWTSLTFLAVLNLSHNHLVGPIPQGKQFNTFENNSYDGNLELCGLPLSKKCSDDEAPHPPLSIKKEDNFEFAGGFGWKAVSMGYGCGMVIGLVMGYLIFLTEKPKWFVRIVEGEQHKKMKRSNKSAHRRGGRRN